jgi:hypothetical protein
MTLDILREALLGIEAEWVRLGAPIVSRLRPGLSGDQLDDLGERYAWDIPPELRVWWGWHDGTNQVGHPWLQSIGPASLWFLPAERALKDTELEREIRPDHPEDPGWRRSWLTIMNFDATRLYVDCSTPAHGVRTWLPIGLVHKEWDNADVPVAQSLTQAARMWLWLLQQNYYAVDANGFLNTVDTNPIPSWIESIGIA